MLKLALLSDLAIAVAASGWPASAVATVVHNGQALQGVSPNAVASNSGSWQSLSPNGVQEQGFASNGTLDQGRSPTGLITRFMTLRAVRLVLPDGTELVLREAVAQPFKNLEKFRLVS